MLETWKEQTKSYRGREASCFSKSKANFGDLKQVSYFTILSSTSVPRNIYTLFSRGISSFWNLLEDNTDQKVASSEG
jgi:hypothetical protein